MGGEGSFLAFLPRPYTSVFMTTLDGQILCAVSILFYYLFISEEKLPYRTWTVYFNFSNLHVGNQAL